MNDEPKRITVRLSDSTHRKMKLICMFLGKSMQDFMEDAVEKSIENHAGALEDVIRQAESFTSPQQQDNGQ